MYRQLMTLVAGLRTTLLRKLFVLLAALVVSAQAMAVVVTLHPLSGTHLGTIALGQSINVTVVATGGGTPYKYWQCDAGAPDYDGNAICLPAGLTIHPDTGVLSGTPTTPGTYTFTVSAVENFGDTGAATYTLVVSSALPPTAGAVNATVPANSSSNAITLNLGGGAATSVTVSSPASHGTATASGTSITYTPTAGYSGSDSFSYTATNGNGTSSPATVSVTVTPPTLSFTPASLSNGMVGSAYSTTVSASNGMAPYSYAIIAGSLPAGLSLNSSTGVISGTPSASGTANLTLAATDANSVMGARAYTLTIAVQPPTASAVSATVAANSSSNPITLNLGGGTTTSVAVSSPASHGTATASGTSITYTPTAGYSGSDSFAYTATNASGTSSPATVTVTVSPPILTLTPASLSNGMVGSAYSASVSASNGMAPYTYVVSAGALPNGLILNANGSISGTPSASGTANLTITAADANSATGSRAYTLTIAVQPPTASAVSATVAANSSSNSITLNLGGGVASGVTVSSPASHGTATASGTSISYTPTAGYSGSDSFAYTATNASGTSSPATVTVTVSPPTLSFTPASLSNGMVGSPYSASVSASNGMAPYTYVVSAGALPNGLILNPNGSISGTPSASGTANLTITATDANSATGSRAYTLTIAVQPPTASAVSATVAANSSSNPITLNLGGGAASGVTVSSPASHGTATASGTSISYTPTAGYSGSDSFTYTATNASGTSSPATVTVTVSPAALSFIPASLGSGTVGSAYSTTVSASGGTAPYSYAISAGALPPGLTFNPSTGAISGMPSAIGTANLTISATDVYGATGSRAYTLTISVQAPTAGAVSTTVAANSSSNPISLNLGGGAASSVAVSSPASHGTATVSGTSITYTPNSGYSGTDSFTYTVTNGSGTSSPATVTITVNPALPITGEVTLTVAANSVDNLVPISLSGGAASTIAIATAPAHGTTKVDGTTIRYTPAAGYSGSDSFTYTASNVTGTSAPAKVTITMTRPDPTKTADVANMVATHTDVAKRFTRAQVTNFQSRLEWLHRRLDGGSVRSGSLEQTTPAARPSPRPAAPNIAGNGFAPFADAGSTAPSATGQTPLPFRSGPVPTGQEPTFNIGGRANNLGNSGLDVWSAGVISLGHYKEADIHFSTSGISFGADQRISNKLVLGAGIGFGHERQKVGNDGSRNTADDYSFSVYGTYQPLPALYLDGVIGTGRMDIDMRRHISDASGDAQAKRSGTQWFASLSGSYEFQNEHYTLSPYGRVDYAITRLDAVTETGPSSDTLVYLSQRATMSKVALGLRGESTYVLDSVTMRPYFRLEYQRDLENPGAARIAYADDISGTVYQILPTGVARNSLVFGVGSDILYRAWTFSGRYQFTNNSGAMKMHTLGVEVRRSF